MSTRFVLSQHFETVAQQLATRTLELKEALAEGMQSGPPRHADDVFDEVEAQLRKLASRGAEGGRLSGLTPSVQCPPPNL